MCHVEWLGGLPFALREIGDLDEDAFPGNRPSTYGVPHRFTLSAVGEPLVFATASNNSYTLGRGQHPDVAGGPVLASGKSIYQWFNTAAFAQPANFTSGNLARTYTGVRQDKTKNLDFSLFKNFRIRERYQLAFRAETFNLTNTPVFGAPGTTVNSANFGIVTGQSNTPQRPACAKAAILIRARRLKWRVLR